jgi:hypothetical protein
MLPAALFRFTNRRENPLRHLRQAVVMMFSQNGLPHVRRPQLQRRGGGALRKIQRGAHLLPLRRAELPPACPAEAGEIIAVMAYILLQIVHGVEDNTVLPPW